MEETITKFFGFIESNVQDMEYGTLTINVVIVNGLPVLKTTNMVLNKRKRYKINEKAQKVDKNDKSR